MAAINKNYSSTSQYLRTGDPNQPAAPATRQKRMNRPVQQQLFKNEDKIVSRGQHLVPPLKKRGVARDVTRRTYARQPIGAVIAKESEKVKDMTVLA